MTTPHPTPVRTWQSLVDVMVAHEVTDGICSCGKAIINHAAYAAHVADWQYYGEDRT